MKGWRHSLQFGTGMIVNGRILSFVAMANLLELESFDM